MGDTVILFQPERLNQVLIIFELSNDFILDYFYTGAESHYFKTGLYQRLMDKAETDAKKQKIRDMYGHLIKKDT